MWYNIGYEKSIEIFIPINANSGVCYDNDYVAGCLGDDSS